MSSEALLQAAASGNVAKVDAILKAGAVHIDVVDKMGHTALLTAAVSFTLCNNPPSLLAPFPTTTHTHTHTVTHTHIFLEDLELI